MAVFQNTNSNITTTVANGTGSLSLVGNLWTSANAYIAGDLTVDGNVTYINITSLNVEDPIISLGRGPNDSPLVSNDGKDRGENMWYYTTAEHSAFIGWQNATGCLIAATNVVIANEIVTVNNWGTFRMGNVIADEITGNLATIVGNINAGNLRTTGLVTATGNVTGGNINTAGLITAGGNITSNANVNVAGLITAGGNIITAANVNVAGLITAGGNIITAANVNVAGLITAGGNITSNANIRVAGLITAGGNITSNANVNVAGLITAGGNIITAANVNVAGLITAGGNITSNANVNVAGLISATGNINTAANVNVAGLISATGNIIGGNLITSGSANVGAITISGNLNSGNLFTSGIVSAGGNITTAANVNVAGLITAGGNITSNANVNVAGLITATGNITTAANVNVAGLITATGDIIGGNLLTPGSVIIGNIFSPLLGAMLEATTEGQANGVFVSYKDSISNAYGSFVNGVRYQGTQSSPAAVQQDDWLMEFGAQGYDGLSLGGGGKLAWRVDSAVAAGSLPSRAELYVTQFGCSVPTLGLTVDSNLTVSAYGNIVTPANVSATTNVVGGNILTSGLISATGNVTAGNILTAGIISAAGNLYAPNINSSGAANIGSLTTTGNVSAGNLFTTGVVSAAGNVTGGNILTAGSITAEILYDYSDTSFYVNPASTSRINILSATGNVTGSNVLTSGLISATGNVTAGNVNTSTVRNSAGALTISTGSGNINLTSAANVVVNNTTINGLADPQQNQDAATKYYVDNAVSTQISYHTSVLAATIANLATTTGGTITYAQPNGAGNGVGATLTTTGSFNLIDTANVQTVGTRILVKNEGNAVFNGVYTWSNATAIVRATDADTYGTVPNTLSLNDYFFVSGGNINAGSSYVVNSPTGTITFGTSNITFAQFGSSQVYSANTSAGLSLIGTVFSTKVDNITTAFDGTGNIVVKTSANLTTPNIGAATGTSVSVTGTVTAASTVGGVITGSSVSVTGAVTAASTVGGIITGSSTSVTGNTTAGNLITAGLVSATGTVTGSSLLGSVVSASANITGGNLLTGGLISSTGTVTTAGNVLAGGQVSATGNVTGGNLTTIGTISTSGNIIANNIAAISNGAGTNFKVGDDVWLGDINIADTMSIRGQQNSANGYIVFGNADTTSTLGRSGSGPLTYNGSFSVTGNINGNTNGYAIGYLNIPQVSLSANTTTAASDTGKHYYSTSAANLSLTIANNSSVSWAVGSTITVINQGTGTITIGQGSGVSMYFAGNSTAANRSLSTFGMATIINVASNTWFINGSGVY